MFRRFLLLFFLCVIPCVGQERFEGGELKGFTKSPSEHIIIRIEEPITIYSVHGTVGLKGRDENLRNAVFEIRGPGTSEHVRAATTDEKGSFKISGVPEGAYAFKVTKDGFQSVVGRLLVTSKADHRKLIRIDTVPGV